MNVRNVFVYWVGKSYSLIELLRKIMKYHANNGKNYHLHLLNENNLSNYITELPDGFHELKPAYQADYVRVAVIEKYGGIWLDSDTLVMSNLSNLFDVLDSQQGFFIRQNNELLCNGVFGSRAGTPLLKQWRKDIFQLIEEKGNAVIWSELGNLWLQKTYENTPLFEDYHIYEGLDTMYPVNWDRCLHAYVKQPYSNYTNLIRPFQPLLILIHTVYQSLENHSIPDILDSDYPLNYFIKQSLKQGLVSELSATNQ